MKIEQDYKTCVRFSLRVMQELRDKVYKDSMEHYSVIYNGLHEPESNNVRELYFQAYEMEWLDNHWETLARMLKQYNSEYKRGEQKDITLFFAEYFSKFMSELSTDSLYAKMAMRDLIAAQKKVIEQMISYADRWEERNNQLRVNLKKHKEHFKILIQNNQTANEKRGQN